MGSNNVAILSDNPEANAKLVYSFGDGQAEGSAEMRNLLGGKGANLAEMSSLGLPVPPGFTITTEVCTAYYDNDKNYPPSLQADIFSALAEMEQKVGCKFGDSANPLLLSIRSGARASMPGMMDTVLNLGLNDETVEGLAKKSNNPRFAYDSYRRFIQMYSDVVLGVGHYHFESILEDMKQYKDLSLDTELTAEDLIELVGLFKDKVAEELGEEFPQDPKTQLHGAINAVFDSWMTARAITYRELNDIPALWGTAVNVQSMVFGNMGDDCSTGVAFTRDPSTGTKAYYGEFLVNAQGEDVVAGIRTPQPLTIANKAQGGNLPSMEEVMPEVYAQLSAVFDKLETHYRDMQDIEFTVQNNKLWMLQTRNGKRTAEASIKIAVDMVSEGLINKKEAILRVDPLALDQLLHPTLDPKASRNIIAKGLPASPGAASGKVVFSAEAADTMVKSGENAILVRIETSPEDIHGMHVSEGILTARGGMTSHAAVVARGMGKPCVSGSSEIEINYAEGLFKAKGQIIKKGDIITINGGTGEVMLGEVAMIQPKLSDDFETLMGWADEIRTLKIRTNAETKLDAKTARDFGAEGIGLCRTEHMFFDASRITAMREMILADNKEAREKALDKLLPMQQSDFADIFKAMAGFPVTIRLLDPPLHEFLPHTEEEMQAVAEAANIDINTLKNKASSLHETNPMLGHRGCRLGITYPEIYACQAKAIIQAAVEITKKTGENVIPEIMIPLAMSKAELEILKQVIDDEAKQVTEESGVDIEYLVGTMIELPRAALKADELAEIAEFFSFGTNDLTQTTFGISRDDSASFIEDYKRQGIVEQDPFVTLDIEGVGELIKLAVERGKTTRDDIKLGICGEHGGDPKSIDFCQKAGLNYVSCSPYRVPIARLAAAQAAINN